MKKTTFGELSFRDLYHRPFILAHNIQELKSDQVKIPEEADAVLVYAYIDPTAGITYDILAPARLKDGKVYDEYGIYIAQNCRVVLRNSGFPADTAVLLLDNEADIERTYAKHLSIYDEHYKVNPAREATRNIKEIDHLRHEDCPDDVSVRLTAEDMPVEEIWFTLEGVLQDGNLVGRLINEPFSDFGVHSGDYMALVPFSSEDEPLLLVTTPDCLLQLESEEG